MDEERRWMDRRVEGRTFVEAMGMDEDEGWTWSIEEHGWRKEMDGRTDWRTSRRTNACWATVMDEDDSLLRRWMKSMDEDRLCG
jgi:hypothetical protein